MHDCVPRWQLLALLLAAELAVPLAACRRPAPRAPPQPLRIGMAAPILGVDPHLYNDFNTVSVLSNVFEGLTALDASLAVRPALAESWTSPDETTWRFVLRQGVTFHDGRALRVADVIASLERARRHPRSQFASYLTLIENVKAVDATTVELTTARPNALLLNKLSFVHIVPSDAPDEIERPLGTGPYRLEARSAREVALAAYEQHWAPAALERAVRIEAIPDSAARARRLVQGSLDLITDVASQDVLRLRTTPGVELSSLPSSSVDVLGMSPNAPPFTDPRVRRAVSAALDRQELVDDMLGGLGQPASQLVSSSVFGFDPGLGAPRQDLELARRLLAAARRQGTSVTLALREGVRSAALERQLQAAGFHVRVEPQPWDALLLGLSRGAVPFSYATLVSDSGDASDIFDSTLHARDSARGYGDSNQIGYSNPRLDALIEEAGRTNELSPRRALLQECMRVALEDAVFVPVLVRNENYAARTDLIFRIRVDGRVLASELRRRR